jgi:hypothetical protein
MIKLMCHLQIDIALKIPAMDPKISTANNIACGWKALEMFARKKIHYKKPVTGPGTTGTGR